MAISKITLNGVTQMDVTGKTVTAASMLSPATALKNDGTDITGNIVTKTSANMTASGATVTAPAGYYASDASKSVASGSATAPASITGTGATVSTGTNTLTLSKTISVTPSVTAGYVSSGTSGNASVSLTASVNTRSSSDLTVSGDTVTAPAGYYSSSASKAVATGTAGTPTATKGTVSNHAVTVTPSVTNTTGYITGGTKTGTGVSVSASELVSGSQTVTENGTIDVTNLASITVDVPSEGEYYMGVDLTQKFATEISSSGGNPWAWIKSRITSGDYSGLRVGDYIPFTCTNAASTALNARILGFNTYTNYGDGTNVLENVSPSDRDYKGVHYRWNADGSCTITTDSGGATAFSFCNIIVSTNSLPSYLVAGNTYYLKFSATNVRVNVIWYYSGSTTSEANYTGDSEITVPANAIGIIMRLTVQSGVTANETVKPVLLTALTKVGNHIDFFAGLWPTTHPINTVQYNNGTSSQNFPWLASDAYLYANSLSGNVPNAATADPATTTKNYTSDGIYYYLPTALKNVIVTKRAYIEKRYTSGTLLTEASGGGWADIGKMWLPDEIEVYGTTHWSKPGYATMGFIHYPFFKTAENRTAGGNQSWYLLSVGARNSTYWCFVSRYGNADTFNANSNYRLPVCFRIA